MNIFVLSEDPVEAAQMQCDKHVVKMVIESGQILATVRRVLDGYISKSLTVKGGIITRYILDGAGDFLPKATHVNHPCVKWARGIKRKL
jgi:intergrase/recombinase